jgi:integrase
MQIVCTVCDLHAKKYIGIMYKYAKDGVSILTILDTRRPKQSGLYPVKVQVIYNRTQKYYSTGKELSSEDWAILPSTKSKKLLSVKDEIETSFDKVKNAVKRLSDEDKFSFEALNVQLGKGVVSTINEAFKMKIELLKSEERIGTKIFYECALHSIAGFAGDNIPYENITVSWLKRYEKYMLDAEKSYTTIGMYIRGLRTVINDAVKAGLIKSSFYPFGKGKYEIPEGEGRKLALTLKQIKEIISFSDGLEATEHYRDLWFFSYLCNGINIVDMLKLKFGNIENGELSFYRSKTIKISKKKTKIQVIVTPEMTQIIKRWGNSDKGAENYIFPFLKGGENAEDIRRITADVTKRINFKMDYVAKELDLPHISTYTARHSFATVLKRSGANIAYISESLGHNDLKTTENYLASFEREEREKNASLLTNFGD